MTPQTYLSKSCKECGESKIIDCFYKHKANIDGYLNQCKECVKKRVRKYRADNIDRVRKYDRDRGNLPKRVDARKKYAKTDNYKKSHSKANFKYKEKNPKKVFAHRAIQKAVEVGAIKPMPCEICGKEKSEAHHDDYNKPYKVRWLCSRHHKDWHRDNEAII